MAVMWPDRLIGSWAHRKRPVIGREPSGPFSTQSDRRILATRSDGCTPSASFPRHHSRICRPPLGEIPALTKERGPTVVPTQLHSGWVGFGSTPSFFQNGLLRKPLAVPPTPSGPPKGGTDGRNYLVTLIDHSPKQLNQVGNQQTARAGCSTCDESEMIGIMNGSDQCRLHGGAL